jgi:seryl-tRNA synthetase
MLQISYIKENKDLVINGLKKRNIPEVEQKIDAVLTLDEERKKWQQTGDDTKNQIKTL